MAAFKAFAIWFPPERLALANGIQMISGGLGALAATTPVEVALRGLCGLRGIDPGAVSAAALCSVVPPLTGVVVDAIQGAFGAFAQGEAP